MTASHLRSTLNIQKPVEVLIFNLLLSVVIFVQIFEFYLVTQEMLFGKAFKPGLAFLSWSSFQYSSKYSEFPSTRSTAYKQQNPWNKMKKKGSYSLFLSLELVPSFIPPAMH
jgi:hypothetical protein